MANKYLEKIAGIGSAVKSFAGHVSGKTLANAKNTHFLDEVSRSKEIPKYEDSQLQRAYNSLHKLDTHRLTNQRNKARLIAGTSLVGAGAGLGMGLAHNKSASFSSSAKAFVNHLSGKALHEANTSKSVLKGLVDSDAETTIAHHIQNNLSKDRTGDLFGGKKYLRLKHHAAQAATAGGIGTAGAGVGAYEMNEHFNNKYLNKAAGIRDMLKGVKAFHGHYTGETLADAKAANTIDVAKHQPHKTGESTADLKDRQKLEIDKLKAKHQDAKGKVKAVKYTAGGLGAYAGLLYGDAKLKQSIKNSVDKKKK